MDLNAFGDWLWSSLQQLSSIAALGALFAVVVSYFSYRGTIRQKTLADNRNAWWNRVQWAIDASLSKDEQHRATGLAALEQLQDSELATLADQMLLAAMANSIVDEALETLDLREDTEAMAGSDPDPTLKVAKEGTPAMTHHARPRAASPDSAPAGKYEVTLASRAGKVVYAKSLTQKRILESAERIIATADKNAAKQSE